MLQLKNIRKSYTTNNFTQVALDGVSLNFRNNEFVAILGPSGSGKTTGLNIVGGLDQYDSGDLIINGKSSQSFKDRDWDAYRNNSVGFIFQSYNLISHLSLIDNVEMGMTLSGVPGSEKRRKALEVLERVGLKDHVHKRPNQLSGGQMQRVAIARALANDPEIILADEPTGALDTKTSVQIMELIKEIAQDKLVIMVTHNPELAAEYADRIVSFKDGRVVADTNPYEMVESDSAYQLKRTSMSFLTALKISAKNIATKKWRTALTAFASSIGIIGIALILALSSGFQVQIDEFQQDALAEFPIMISQTPMTIGPGQLPFQNGDADQWEAYHLTDAEEVFPYDPADYQQLHTNVFSSNFMEHLEGFDPETVNSIGYTRRVGMNLMREIQGNITSVFFSAANGGNGSGPMANVTSSSFPETLGNGTSWLEANYDLLAGSFPQSDTDLVLVVDEFNRVDAQLLANLGFDVDEIESLDFAELVGTEFILVLNDNFYQQTELGNFLQNTDLEAAFQGDGNLTLTLAGIVRLNPEISIGLLNSGIAYSDALVQRLIEMEMASEIVAAQLDSDYNVMTFEPFMDDDARNSFMAFLGGDATPASIFIYPSNFDAKELVLEHLDAFNATQESTYQIVYTDLAATMTDLTGGIMGAITLVLLAFASISLVVSLIMIAIITYISVMERTKEIGILRALGARKKDITRVFNAETFIIGLVSGMIAISTTYVLTVPINQAIYNLTDLQNVAQLNPIHAVILVAISLTLTLLGGLIPAKMAAKKDPVEALRQG